jgi:WD40 repeat protein
LIRVLKGHTDTIQMITGLHKNQVFSASSDGSVRGWDISKAD